MKYNINEIKNNPIFENIDDFELEKILNCLQLTEKKYDKGEILLKEHDPYKGIGIILRGEVLVVKEDALGTRHVIAKFAQKQLFGEMVAFTNNTTMPATVIANSQCEILYLSPQALVGTCEKMCIGHRTLLLNFLKIISNKALMLNRKLDYLSIKSMRKKLAKYLLNFYSNNSEEYFKIPLNRNELANFLNVSRPSMSRELALMKEDNLIDYHKNTFRLLNVKELTRIVYDM